jgi:hypothetical protein
MESVIAQTLGYQLAHDDGDAAPARRGPSLDDLRRVGIDIGGDLRASRTPRGRSQATIFDERLVLVEGRRYSAAAEHLRDKSKRWPVMFRNSGSPVTPAAPVDSAKSICIHRQLDDLEPLHAARHFKLAQITDAGTPSCRCRRAVGRCIRKLSATVLQYSCRRVCSSDQDGAAAFTVNLSGVSSFRAAHSAPPVRSR